MPTPVRVGDSPTCRRDASYGVSTLFQVIEQAPILARTFEQVDRLLLREASSCSSYPNGR